MTSYQKDQLANGEYLNKTIQQFRSQEQQQQGNQTKRQLQYEDEDQFNDEMHEFDPEFETPNKKRKQHQNNNNNNQNQNNQHAATTFTFTNTLRSRDIRNTNQRPPQNRSNNNQRNGQQQQLQGRNDNNLGNEQQQQQGRISRFALDYAANSHFQSFKIECNPKITDPKQATKFIQELTNSIKPEFLKQNPMYSRAVQFDLWWLDKNNDLEIIIKSTELYVYLCKPDRFPKKIMNIELKSSPPKHLPPQHTAILKWLSNTVSIEDLKFNSIFSIEEMIGTVTNRTRHVKIELLDKKEYDDLLNGGQLNVQDRNNLAAYPPLQSSTAPNFPQTTSIVTSNFSETIKSFRDELNQIKTKYEEEQKRIKEKYKDYLLSMNQGLLVIQQEIQTQKEMITSLSNAVDQTLFSTCEKTTSIICNVLKKIKKAINANELDGETELVTQHLSLINTFAASYLKNRLSLESLSTKQNESLTQLLNTLFVLPND
ncbi:unnamed protein product [Didymodactylos carnosus]|uniref:Uncharacterized protein n=1 Tax=Didymodactylos carnosus TaxID=1234261 RepID=A0A815D872_9BILA|nr:unnamed protein product [Didymodactylos carnosus]CAF4101954.1 unnamed protein product [Didymodactylos carnosus]